MAESPDAILRNRLAQCTPEIREWFQQLDAGLRNLPGVTIKTTGKGEGYTYSIDGGRFAGLHPKHRARNIGVFIQGVNEKEISKVAPVRVRQDRAWIYLTDQSKVEAVTQLLHKAYLAAAN